MNRNHATMLSLTASLSLLVCLSAPVERLSDGALIHCGKYRIRLQIFDLDVLRVTASLEENPAETHSLAVIAEPLAVPFDISETKTDVTVSTSRMRVRVSIPSGKIAFLDRVGKTILAETAPASLSANSVAGKDTLRSDATFALDKGEAIYGLGQHQIPTLNYRGHHVRLQQKNTEIAVPMLLSSKGYGLLWDNPAVTDVSVDAGDQGILPSSMMIDEQGIPGALTAHYFRGRNFEEEVGSARDEKIDHNWNGPGPHGLERTNFSVRWNGYLTAAETGEYTVTTTGDDGMRLYLDGKKVAEDWTSRPALTLRAKVHLEAGKRTPITFEYYQEGGEAIAQLGLQKPATQETVHWTSETADAVDYVFFYGPRLERVIQGYRQLTGHAPMFGRWAWGLWQSRERYETQAELLGIVDRYRKEHIPLDGVVQDWQYWRPGEWGSHEFDVTRFPDPRKLMADIHARNAHSIISVWPKFDQGTEAWKEVVDAGGMLPPVINYVYPAGKGQWYDPFSEAGRKSYWSGISKRIAKFGWDGWWLDASEAELSGNLGEFRDFLTGMGLGMRVYNAYPLMHTKAVYEGQRKDSAAKRSFILTRSAYAGQQRYGAVSWSGDINASWDVYRTQIPAGLNFCLSGIPYWNTDTGGFFANKPVTDPDYRDLFERWFQFSTFCPMLRIHGTGTAKEIFRWPQETREVLEAFDELRYHLLPYIYSTSWEVTDQGGTMMRALPLDFQKDPNTYDVPDQYMFGRAILVNPVVEPGAASREVYLPAGADWVDFWTGLTHHGGQSLRADARGKLPLFARAGSIVPYGPKVEHALAPCDPTEIRIYPGANGEFRLYDDAGDGYGYEQGERATIDLKWTEGTRTLVIGVRKGTYPGMPESRSFRVVLVRPGHGVGVANSTDCDRIVEYDGKRSVVRL